MEQNVGDLDRVVRLVLGAVLVLVGIAAYTAVVPGGLIVAGVGVVVGAVLLWTGATRQCLVYQVLGMRTDRR